MEFSAKYKTVLTSNLFIM